jgi:putative salt-induced outer membrane protein
MYKYLTGIMCIVIPLGVSAEDAPTGSKWSGEAEVGYLSTGGNTRSEHKATVESTQKSENETNTAKRWFATEKSAYTINGASYLFLAFTYEDDYFSGYDYQATEAFGYGYRIFRQEDLKWDVEAGVGARQTRTDTGIDDNEGIVKGETDLEWKVTRTSTFTQLLSVESGKDNTVSRSETAIKMQIVGSLAAKMSHRIKHSTTVPPGKKKTDRESVVTLVYSL